MYFLRIGTSTCYSAVLFHTTFFAFAMCRLPLLYIDLQKSPDRSCIKNATLHIAKSNVFVLQIWFGEAECRWSGQAFLSVSLICVLSCFSLLCSMSSSVQGYPHVVTHCLCFSYKLFWLVRCLDFRFFKCISGSPPDRSAIKGKT